MADDDFERNFYHDFNQSFGSASFTTDRFGIVKKANCYSSLMFNIDLGCINGLPLITFVHRSYTKSFRDILRSFNSSNIFHSNELLFRPRKSPAFTSYTRAIMCRQKNISHSTISWVIRYNDIPTYNDDAIYRNNPLISARINQ